MGAIEVRLISEEQVRKLGQYCMGGPGKKALRILEDTFGSRLSYTRGEPEHTAFLEGQKSVIQFINNAVKAAKKSDEEE